MITLIEAYKAKRFPVDLPNPTAVVSRMAEEVFESQE
jgi:hypothetical protein